jgi:hypothetical protein
MSSTQKFRPYLTQQQLHYFLQLCQSDNSAATETIRVRTIKELKLFITKYELGAVAPAYTASSTPRLSMADRLGLDTEDPIQKREAAYATWSANPALCTAEEVKLATLYRYENNLMTTDEEYEYEQYGT